MGAAGTKEDDGIDPFDRRGKRSTTGRDPMKSSPHHTMYAVGEGGKATAVSTSSNTATTSTGRGMITSESTGTKHLIDSRLPKTNMGGVDSDNFVPVVFKWNQGGRKVHLVTDFVGWEYRNTMHRSGNDFSLIMNVPRDGKKHHYKFVVDGEWRTAVEQLSEVDSNGKMINFVDLTNFKTHSELENQYMEHQARTGSSTNFKSKDKREYGKLIPEIEEYAKDPPVLPQQLRNIILNQANKNSRSSHRVTDPRKLNVPLHVSLNHLFCSVIKDGIMVQGITTRYRKKMVTTVYISLEGSFSAT